MAVASLPPTSIKHLSLTFDMSSCMPHITKAIMRLFTRCQMMSETEIRTLVTTERFSYLPTNESLQHGAAAIATP